MKNDLPLDSLILTIRGQKVLIDADLAAIYGVPTKALNQAVKRNLDRFPEDFRFQISKDEWEALNRSQIVTGSQRHRDPRFLPFVFTEHGALMDARLMRRDEPLQIIWRELQPLLAPPPEPPQKEMGFHVREDTAKYRIKTRKRTTP